MGRILSIKKKDKQIYKTFHFQGPHAMKAEKRVGFKQKETLVNGRVVGQWISRVKLSHVPELGGAPGHSNVRVLTTLLGGSLDKS